MADAMRSAFFFFFFLFYLHAPARPVCRFFAFCCVRGGPYGRGGRTQRQSTIRAWQPASCGRKTTVRTKVAPLQLVRSRKWARSRMNYQIEFRTHGGAAPGVMEKCTFCHARGNRPARENQPRKVSRKERGWRDRRVSFSGWRASPVRTPRPLSFGRYERIPASAEFAG